MAKSKKAIKKPVLIKYPRKPNLAKGTQKQFDNWYKRVKEVDEKNLERKRAYETKVKAAEQAAKDLVKSRERIAGIAAVDYRNIWHKKPAKKKTAVSGVKKKAAKKTAKKAAKRPAKKAAKKTTRRR